MLELIFVVVTFRMVVFVVLVVLSMLSVQLSEVKTLSLLLITMDGVVVE